VETEPIDTEPVTGSEEAVEESVDDALSDGKIDTEEAEDILNELASDGEVTAEEVQNLADALSEDGKLTNSEKELIADALVESIAPGESLTKEQIQESGIEYKDLPASTPVEVRQDENGNEVVITAEVAASLVLLENPADLLSTAFSDPGEALQALGNIGADMSDEEREEATEMVVATVVAAGAAINAAAVAAGGATGGGTGGGGSSGGSSSGANSPGSRGGRKW
jgi:polyhydroxyalkanoate synthesis regulator phasin